MIEGINEIHSSLRGRFKGDLLRPGSVGYEDARAIWNGMVSKKPGLIARCAGVGDVQVAVRAASDCKILTAVRSGGHFSNLDNRTIDQLLAEHVSWIRGLFDRLRPAMSPGVYVNFMSGGEQSRVTEAYWERWDRIAR